MNEGSTLRKRIGWVATVVLLAGVVGCGAKDTRPKYVAPKLAASEAATLKADGNYWIDEVDGARIPPPAVTLVVQPGNTVKVAPGERQVVVTRSQNGALVNAGGTGRGNFWKFTYNFRPGHTYKLGGGGSMGPGIKITDTQTGNATLVGG